MAYIAAIGVALGASKAGLTLNGQVVDSAGADVGGAIPTGFVERGGGQYLLHGSIPDGHRGALKVYDAANPGTVLAATAINPEDAENSAAIRAKTDTLPANPAAVGDAMTLDLSQAVPAANAPQTVGDALNAARAEGFGAWRSR